MRLLNWQESKARIEEAVYRRSLRCPTCGCLHERGRMCRDVEYDKESGKFVHR